MDTEVKICRS